MEKYSTMEAKSLETPHLQIGRKRDRSFPGSSLRPFLGAQVLGAQVLGAQAGPGPGVNPMDRLSELEAQSIFIFREGFARLKRLALLWSLGKDSNVMIWLARKAFFGRLPFPALHVDTGKKFPEMYAFRDRYGKEWELDLKIEPCPPLETIDPRSEEHT